MCIYIYNTSGTMSTLNLISKYNFSRIQGKFQTASGKIQNNPETFCHGKKQEVLGNDENVLKEQLKGLPLAKFEHQNNDKSGV